MSLLVPLGEVIVVFIVTSTEMVIVESGEGHWYLPDHEGSHEFHNRRCC